MFSSSLTLRLPYSRSESQEVFWMSQRCVFYSLPSNIYLNIIIDVEAPLLIVKTLQANISLLLDRFRHSVIVFNKPHPDEAHLNFILSKPNFNFGQLFLLSPPFSQSHIHGLAQLTSPSLHLIASSPSSSSHRLLPFPFIRSPIPRPLYPLAPSPFF